MLLQVLAARENSIYSFQIALGPAVVSHAARCAGVSRVQNRSGHFFSVGTMKCCCFVCLVMLVFHSDHNDL